MLRLLVTLSCALFTTLHANIYITVIDNSLRDITVQFTYADGTQSPMYSDFVLKNFVARLLN